MTSVNSYLGATTAGNYTLIVSGTVVGNWVEAYTSDGARVTPVTARTSFWSSTGFLDGGFPARVWKHEFTVYTEASTTRESFVKAFHDYSDLHVGVLQPVAIVSGYTTVTTIYFGLCFMSEIPKLVQPQELLLHAAGMVKLTYMGTTKPTVTP